MALNFGAFMAGFATQAQKIEEESAKIGMELIKEAIEDFREESKDWKSKYNTELKSWEAIAKNVKGMFGNDKQAELKTIAVLEKGKPYALDFIKSAQEQAEKKGFESPAQLIDFGDQTLPKGMSAIDWVRSGAPDMSLEAKPFLDKGQFTGMKTGVFGRQIYPEGMGRIERTEKTYLDLPVGVRKDVVPEATFSDIYSTTEVAEQRTGPQAKSLRNQIVARLSQGVPALAGLQFNVDTGAPIYTEQQAPAVRVVNRHADAVMAMVQRQIGLQREKGINKREALTDADVLGIVRQFMNGDFEIPNFVDTKEQITNFYSVSDLLPKPKIVETGGSDTVTDTGAGGGSGAITQLTTAQTNHPSVANLVTLPSTAPKMGKGARRQAIAQALKDLGVDATVADQYSQTVTLN